MTESTKRKDAAAAGTATTSKETLIPSNSTIKGTQKSSMGLQQFWQVVGKTTERGMFPVVGDCMERMDIFDGDYIQVRFDKMPLPPRYKAEHGENFHDAVLCLYQPDERRTPIIAVKAYGGVFGWMQQVTTMYVPGKSPNSPFQYCYEPLAIFGTVEAVFDSDMQLRWERDLSDRPDTLGTKSTVVCKDFSFVKPVRV